MNVHEDRFFTNAVNKNMQSMAVESMHYACAWIWQLMNYMYAAEMYYVHHASPFYIDVLFTGIKMKSTVL